MNYLAIQSRYFLALVTLFFFPLLALLMHSRYYLFFNHNYNEWRVIEVCALFADLFSYPSTIIRYRLIFLENPNYTVRFLFSFLVDLLAH